MGRRPGFAATPTHPGHDQGLAHPGPSPGKIRRGAVPGAKSGQLCWFGWLVRLVLWM
jgi:hypothetical protein